MGFTITARTDQGVAPPANADRHLLEVIYTTPATNEDGTAGEPVQRTLRAPFTALMSTTITVEDAVVGVPVAQVLKSDGALALKKDLPTGATGNQTWALTQAEVDAINAMRQQVPDDPAAERCDRAVRLVPTTAVVLDFRYYKAFVVPVADAGVLGGENGHLLDTANATRVASIEVGPQHLAALGAHTWKNAHLAIDGRISAQFERGKSVGWLWWLTGDRQLIGFVPDDLSTGGTKEFVVAMPALGAVAPGGPAAKDGCECRTAVPSDVSEAELANNPGVYSEDPGAFCKPFNNPERVLSEKSFQLIARVSEPEIGAEASARTKTVQLLDLDGDGRPDGAPDSGTGGFFARLFGPKATAAAPPLSKYIRYITPKPLAAFIAGLSSGRGPMSSKRPLQWEDDIAQYQATSVALGHLLEYRIRWRSNGYSLGTVAKTLTLAPRQAKRIQKVEWERSERARRSERTTLADAENDSVTRERDFQDNVAANLSEWASGGSHSDVAGIAGGIGFFASGVLGGIGGGAGSSNSSSHQEGGRSTNASEHQRLRDAVRRHGDALRKFESTVVTEVTQEETVTGTTEVVRNINYAHSLTVIYYQILRHLKVETAFAGIRECLFIPFSIKAFDLVRAYRWRESIQAALRSKRYLRALRYLKDVANNFATSDIPPGTRAKQRINYLRGSMFIDLAIERPSDKDDGTLDPGPWSAIQHLLSDPMGAIHSFIGGHASAERDKAFQKHYAPGIAAKWANRITLTIKNRSIRVDSTLATAYRFNKTVRIDFTVPLDQLGALTREELQNVTVEPRDELAKGSVANLKRISFTYHTDHFNRTITSDTGANDLIRTSSGATESAAVFLPLDQWEQVNERLEIRRAVRDFIEHLNEHIEYYHKAIWWRMDRDRLLMMLDGFHVPFSQNVSIASVVDREPLGIIGNCLVYRVGAASFLGMGSIKTPEGLYELYAEKQPVRDPVHLSLPTDGLYAQTIMDECVALEEHFGNRDWALNDKDPDLGSIDPSLLASRRSDPVTNANPTPFPATIINLQNAPEAPAPSGLAGVLGAVTNPNAFRDMAGLAGTQANALAGLQAAAGLATNFGNQAAALELAKLAKAQEATRTADQKIASIDNAVKKGLTTPQDGADQAKNVLAAMNPDAPKAAAPHENPAINNAIAAAKDVPGSTIEANTGEGGVKVKMGDKNDAVVKPTIVEVDTTPIARTFGDADDRTGITTLRVRGKDMTDTATLQWKVPASESAKYSIVGSTSADGGIEVQILGKTPGRTNIEAEIIEGGVQVARSVFQLCIPQFITVDDTTAEFDGFLTTNDLHAIKQGILDEARAVLDLRLHNNANVRLLWKSQGHTVPAHVPPGMVTALRILGTDPAVRKRYGVSMPGPGHPGVGDKAFAERIDLFPATYLDPDASGDEINQTVNQLLGSIMAVQVSDPAFEDALIRILGRLLGETMAHEIYHCLLPVPFTHNVDSTGADTETADIMDNGGFRSFEERTGIVAPTVSFSTADEFVAALQDNGIGAINRLTGTSLANIRATFPVPPTPPFN